MAGGSKEARLADIGLFRLELGRFERPAFPLHQSDIDDRYQDLALCRRGLPEQVKRS